MLKFKTLKIEYSPDIVSEKGYESPGEQKQVECGQRGPPGKHRLEFIPQRLLGVLEPRPVVHVQVRIYIVGRILE